MTTRALGSLQHSLENWMNMFLHSDQIHLVCIGEEDLCDILKELTGVAARWRNIGILLGIPPSDLDAVRSDRPIDCMLEMLLAWLRKAYNVNRFGEPTWLKLVEVVANKAGGENTSLAEDIAGRHKCELDQMQS